MIAGPYSRAVVAEFLGKREDEIAVLIKEDGLPALRIATKTRPADKITLTGLHRWLKARAVNSAPTIEELEWELDRAAQRVAQRRVQKKVRRISKEEHATV